ncbi:MAG: hypothetical protein JRI68_17680 [Deltaproteobacteria bacterium]|nr:hypothetical protein [Deltaproteobacteria bacterium]
MDRSIVQAAALFALSGTWLCPSDGHAQPLGGVGESCVKRADCEPALRCMDNRCVAPEDGATTKPAPSAAPAGAASSPEPVTCETDGDCASGAHCREDRCVDAETLPGGWADFELEGAHPFFGLSIGPAVSGTWLFRAKQFDVDPAFFFAFRGGAYFNRVELAMEVAPVTWLPQFDQEPSFSFLVSIGGLPKIDDHVYWPLRFGVGLSTINTFNDQTLMQGRVDLLGVAIQHGHLLFEINLPSVRFHSEFDQYGLWGWLFNISAAYVI